MLFWGDYEMGNVESDLRVPEASAVVRGSKKKVDSMVVAAQFGYVASHNLITSVLENLDTGDGMNLH